MTSTSSYANTLFKKNNPLNGYSYRKQAEQFAREKKKQSCGKKKVVIPSISPHFEDCPIGEAEKDIIVGKLLEDRALEISTVAQEIRDIQKEWHRELRVNDNEQCNLHHPKLKEIEDRERELNNIEEEIIDILKNRDEERSLKKLRSKGNSQRRPYNDTNQEDSESSNEIVFKGPLQYSCQGNKDASIMENNVDLFEEDVQETIDVENEISFIEGLIEEDILGSNIDPTLDLPHSLDEIKNINEIPNWKEQSSDLEAEYFEIKNLLEEIELGFG